MTKSHSGGNQDQVKNTDKSSSQTHVGTAVIAMEKQEGQLIPWNNQEVKEVFLDDDTLEMGTVG